MTDDERINVDCPECGYGGPHARISFIGNSGELLAGCGNAECARDFIAHLTDSGYQAITNETLEQWASHTRPVFGRKQPDEADSFRGAVKRRGVYWGDFGFELVQRWRNATTDIARTIRVTRAHDTNRVSIQISDLDQHNRDELGRSTPGQWNVIDRLTAFDVRRIAEALWHYAHEIELHE